VIGLQALSSPVIRHAARLVRDGVIGAPKVMRVFGSAAGWGETTSPHYAYLQDKRNGATLESIGGGHTLAPVEALVGPYLEVDARNSTLRRMVRVQGGEELVERTCADHMLVLGLHANGCISTFEVVGGTPDRPALFEIVGETGWLRVVGLSPGTCQIAPLAIEASVPVEPAPSPVAPQLRGPPANVAEIYASLARNLRSGRRELADFDDAVRLTRLLDAIDLASATGQRQAIPG
jgi:predicted dehydrogenase